MKALEKVLVQTLALFGMLAVMIVPAQAQPERYLEGTHYDVLERPVRTADPDRIEVTEVFWYGCNHCYAFEPLLENWTENLAEDVQFVRSPGMWNEQMEIHARLFYAAQELDVLEQLHSRAFNEIHQRANYLLDEDSIASLFSDLGVNEADFEKTWSSFSVTSSVNRANTRTRDYGVRGVPTVIVNGKYRITAPSHAETLRVADFLIEKERNS